MANEYNKTKIINFTDEASLKMFDKLCRVGGDRKIAPNGIFDNIQYPHRKFYDEFNLLIGDCYFMIPPEFIAVMSEAQSSKVVQLRQENTQRMRGGYHRRTILVDLVFYGNEQINGYKVDGPEGVYHVDGLRQLLAQFKTAPFLPVINDLMNNVYNIWAVALQDITISTLNGFPDILTAQITLLEVNLFPYLEVPNLFFIDMIDWDLFRFYYQRLLTDKYEYKKLQSMPIDKSNGHFKLSILNANVFENKRVSSANMLDILTDKNILLEGQDTNYITWVSTDEMNVRIIDFQCKYSNILSCAQLADSGEATMQYLGGLDTIYQITFETEEYSVVQAIEQCQISNDLFTRQNQKFQSVGFVRLESELVEFCGGLFVMIENVTTNTVPGYADLYHVSVQAVSYDIAQSERENLNGFVPFENGKDITEQAIEQSSDGLSLKIDQDLYAEQKIRSTMEMYPDLRLPTYSEVDEVITKIKKFRESNKNAIGEDLTSYPLESYPRNPFTSLHGLNKDTQIPEDKIFSAKVIQDKSNQYEGYVDPDFYVFYPFTYADISSTETGAFTEFHKNVINESKKVVAYGGTYEDTFVDETTSYSSDNYGGVTTPVIESMIAKGKSFIGCPYVWGAAGEKTASGKRAFDCSGYISYLMQDAGLLTHRATTAEMPGKTAVFETIPLEQIKRGDLIHRYAGEKNNGTGHVALFIGNGKTLEAQSSKTGVVESDYNASRYVRGLRIKAAQSNAYTMKTGATSVNDVGSSQNKTAANIIYSNEAPYDSVNPNDNGSLSIGSGQWHGNRAKDLLLKMIDINPAESKSILGLDLFNKVKSNQSWSTYIPNNVESTAMKKLINTSFGRSLQDKQIQEDVNVYMQKGRSYGLTDEKALTYFADGVHQYGTNSEKWATIAKTAVANGGSLDAIYNATKVVLGNAYNSRRTSTYNKLKDSAITTSSETETKNAASEYQLTEGEFDSICKIVASETMGQPYDAQVAVAQCLFDRITNEEKKWGTLNQILMNGGFKGTVNEEYDLSETEKAVKEVFCNNKKWVDSSVWYFMSAISNPSIYQKYQDSYDKIGSVGSNIFWGKKDLASKPVSFVIGDGELPGVMTTNKDGVTEKVSYEAGIVSYDESDVDEFGMPYMINTEKMFSINRANDKVIGELNEEKILINTSFVNQYLYSRKGTLLRAFPTYLFCILDDQAQWYDGKKLWTNYYTHRAVVDIQVHESNETPLYTASISATNSYHNLDRTAGGLSKYDLKKDDGYDFVRRWIYGWSGVMLGFGPKLTKMLCELHSEIYDHALVREGARVHLRIGYGSDPFSLETAMNGHISDLSVGEQVSMVVVSDGSELLNNVVSAKKTDNNNGWLGLFGLGESQEASNIIANQMCDRTNNTINYLWKGAFEASKNNIEHFGLFKNKSISSLIYRSPIAEVADGWQKQYDILKNIYRASYEPGQYIYKKGILGADGEENIVFSTYNKTPWDVFQICTQTTPEYIIKPSYHQFDSRLFFGLPMWIEKYRYDKIGGKIVEECKAASQVHYIDSMTDIIDNQVRVSSRDSFTNARVMYQLGSTSVTTGTLFSDRTIDFSKQKTRIIDSAVVQDALGPDWFYERTFYKLGKKTARKMGISNLLIGWEQQYKGSLVLLGNPGIHANDTLLLNDTHVNMFGIPKVREMFHSFNSNTGFTTTVVPGMVGFNTDNNSGMILIYQNYLKLLNAFASYTFVKKQMNNTYQNYATIYSAVQGSIKNMQARYSTKQIADVAEASLSAGNWGLTAISVNKWGKSIWSAYKGVKAGKNVTEVIGIAESLAGVKKAYSTVKTAKNLKNIVGVIKAGSSVVNTAPIVGQLIYVAIWLVCDSILDSAIEWFANKNVVTLLPMWYENYPFIAGVKDGQNILVMKGNPNATEENDDTSSDDQFSVEDY